MDSGRLWGWDKLFGPGGEFLWKRTLVNAAGHFGISFGAALFAIPASRLANWEFAGYIYCGIALGVAAMALREGIQYAISGSPHILDRALDMLPSPFGGAVGGLVSWAISQQF